MEQQQVYGEEDVKREIAKYKKKMNQELKMAYDQNNILEEENRKLVTYAKTMQAKIDKLLNTFSYYFKEAIPSLDSLIEISEEKFREPIPERKHELCTKEISRSRDSDIPILKSQPTHDEQKLKHKLKKISRQMQRTKQTDRKAETTSQRIKRTK